MYNLLIIILIYLKIVLSKDCSTGIVSSGQSCYDVWVSNCKNTWDLNTLKKYNPDLDCTLLSVGQRICCNEGTLPSLIPPQLPNGTCQSYIVKSGDTCFSIGGPIGAKPDQIEKFNLKSDTNNGTWGWKGCSLIQQGQRICIGPGTPPPPSKVTNASCGMIASGNGTDIRCPLKVCCSEWGYCGINKDFCLETESKTNNPGTKGCIRDCQMDYKATSGPPAKFLKIGYYESWAPTRKCLTMSSKNLDYLASNNGYTHIHFAFANITNDFKIAIDAMDEFQKFANLKGNFKKIISFGGWAFSTSLSTTWNFVKVVQPGYRDIFAANLRDFVNQYNLDGVDFDWEYPGTGDIPGSANHFGPEDGENYNAFLSYIKQYLPDGKSISIAAPASFWYLRGFPIEEMSSKVDYIVYMTYDLHGQWDIGIPSLGGYLKSHLNWTETIEALTMITKAGVPSNKVIMGVGTYGRSFQQVDPQCAGPTCSFTGTKELSLATPGECTQTAGYISLAEINLIIKDHPETIRENTYDPQSDSNIMTYNTHDWVAYNTLETMNARAEKAKAMNLGGTVEWAVDLQTFFADDGIDPNLDLGPEFDFSQVDCMNYENVPLDDSLDNVPKHCQAHAMAVSLTDGIDEAFQEYTRIKSNFTKAFVDVVRPAMVEGLNEKILSEFLGIHSCFCTFPKGNCSKLQEYFKCGNRNCNADALSYFTISTTNKKGFYDDLTSFYQIKIDDSVVAFDKEKKIQCGTGFCDSRTLGRDCNVFYNIKGLPRLLNGVIPNPADVFMDGNYDDYRNFQNTIQESMTFSDEDSASMVQGSYTSILVPKAAIKQMKEIIKQADEIAKEKEKSENSLYISIVLTVVGVIATMIGGPAGIFLGVFAAASQAVVSGIIDGAANLVDVFNAVFSILSAVLKIGAVGEYLALTNNALKIEQNTSKLLTVFGKNSNFVKVTNTLKFLKRCKRV